jgi:predicted dienelactone hydrolase
MNRLLPLSLSLLLVAGCSSLKTASRHTGPWNTEALKQAPAAQWGARTGLVQEVYYQGEPYRGKPTRIFAYLGRPTSGNGPFPAMVLVHGGGGKAFRDWAEHWAKRGYVALAMDTAGCGPNGPSRMADPAKAMTPSSATSLTRIHATCGPTTRSAP